MSVCFQIWLVPFNVSIKSEVGKENSMYHTENTSDKKGGLKSKKEGFSRFAQDAAPIVMDLNWALGMETSKEPWAIFQWTCCPYLKLEPIWNAKWHLECSTLTVLKLLSLWVYEHLNEEKMQFQNVNGTKKNALYSINVLEYLQKPGLLYK